MWVTISEVASYVGFFTVAPTSVWRFPQGAYHEKNLRRRSHERMEIPLSRKEDPTSVWRFLRLPVCMHPRYRRSYERMEIPRRLSFGIRNSRPLSHGEVSQLVEKRILESRMRFAQQFSIGLENPCVVGSIPTLTTD